MMKRLALFATRLNVCNSKSQSQFSSNVPKQTIFDKILSKKIPSTTVYQDNKIYAFKDVSPQAPIHVLIIPKQKDGLTGISQAEDRHKQILGYMLVKAKNIADQLGLKQGYRLVINQGRNGQQSVDHLHIHLIGGRQMNWPPG